MLSLTEKVRNERPEAAGDTDMASTDTVTLIKQNHGLKNNAMQGPVSTGEKKTDSYFGKSLKVNASIET